VEEDKELRDYVRNIVTGQIVSIIREETKSILAEVLEKRRADIIKRAESMDIEQIVKEYIFRCVDNALVKKEGYSLRSPEMWKVLAREVMDKNVKALFPANIDGMIQEALEIALSEKMRGIRIVG
jgi:cell division ATPase FtsA